MLAAVTRAIHNGEHLVVEGGTGVGKSMAYLLPAALFALSKGQRVVISTNTINLQEQLLHKDIPAMIEVLDQAGLAPEGSLKAASLKGRTNYLCLRRWSYLNSADGPSVDEARLLGKPRSGCRRRLPETAQKSISPAVTPSPGARPPPGKAAGAPDSGTAAPASCAPPGSAPSRPTLWW